MEVGARGSRASLMPHGLIDEYQLFLLPVMLGGGTPMFPSLDGQACRSLRGETKHFSTAR
ncbi:dihydrofolate reductase family protein [Nocardia aurea]|uniref:dihydrofolate reductase family protein n=1 Tax=Nocardia aurea TaxID=2144174 RepID=UPI003F4D22C1